MKFRNVPSQKAFLKWRTWIAVVAVVQLLAAQHSNAAVIISGLMSTRLSPELKGQILIEELNCVACHASNGSLPADSKKSPRLAGIGSRVNPLYLESFIRDPHGTKPGTTMPDLFSFLSPEKRSEVSREITHFLLSLRSNDFLPEPPDSVAAQHGQRLFHSRGCAQCHSPRDDQGKELLVESSTPLGALERKYSFKSLVDFLHQPHAVRPSGRMPDMRLSGQDIERISHFLLKDTRVPGSLGYILHRGQVWEGLESENVKPERAGHVKDFDLESLGKPQHHTAIQYDGWFNITNQGRYSFFLKMNGGSLTIDGGKIVQQDPSDQRGVKQLEGTTQLDAGWHRIQLIYFHTGHSPRFSFEMEGPQFSRGLIPSSMLSVSKEPVPIFEPLKVDAELAARGREQFGKLGCANCHDDLKIPSGSSVAFSGLNPDRGCLSDGRGPWPHFDLTKPQREWMLKALPRAENVRLDEPGRIDKTLVTFNCVACHERAGLGGIAAERNALFTGSQPPLGDQGRLPPPLTQVGAKLRREWLADVLLRGKRQRNYLDASMPQFGQASVGHLVELFARVDSVEKAPGPVSMNPQLSRSVGFELVGSTGMSCIACHEFNGQKTGEFGALDIARVTERLQKNWFHLYLRQPARFHPGVIMPSYWPDGKSVRPEVLDGDATRQIEAIWSYLADGVRARKPIGLSRESNEIHVGDVAEICRGQSSIGYRGIAVGYPERINLTFDSGEMTLRQLWKGEFTSVEPGHFRPRGTDLITLPPGVPFHRLKSMEENWPYKGKSNHAFPQDHGYQFRGYHLDAQRRPTFTYLYGNVAVEDFFEDVRGGDGMAFFKRTLRFASPAGRETFHFRAGVGKKALASSDRAFEIDQLHLRITSDHKGVLREGENREVLIQVNLPDEGSSLTLEYQW